MPAQNALVTGGVVRNRQRIARLLAADKCNLVLVARTQEKLDQLAAELRRDCGVAVRVLTHDLADPRSPQAIFDALAADGLTVDVLGQQCRIRGRRTGGRGCRWNATRHDSRQRRRPDAPHPAVSGRAWSSARRGGILNVASTAAFQPRALHGRLLCRPRPMCSPSARPWPRNS